MLTCMLMALRISFMARSVVAVFQPPELRVTVPEAAAVTMSVLWKRTLTQPDRSRVTRIKA